MKLRLVSLYFDLKQSITRELEASKLIEISDNLLKQAVMQELMILKERGYKTKVLAEKCYVDDLIVSFKPL